MKQLPIFLNLKGRTCLVIGADHAALCKIDLLLSVGALVHVNATAPDLKIKAHLHYGRISFSETAINNIEDSDYALVIIADCDSKRALSLSEQCQQRGIPVNVVDQPALCSFTIPSIIDRNPITIAIGSGGSSPVLARRIRSQIESLVPKAIGTLAELLGQFRGRVAQQVPFSERRAFWDSILDGPIAQQVLDGKAPVAERALRQAIDEHCHQQKSEHGQVTLIDARHNSSELMTLEAVQKLHRAEHILHAPSIDPEILRLARRDAHQHALQRLDHDRFNTPAKFTEKLTALALGGNNVVLLVSNTNWSRALIDEINNQLQSSGLASCALLSVECRETLLREAS